MASLAEIKEFTYKKMDSNQLNDLLNEAQQIKEWITNSIYSSREKDYSNPFRLMVYESLEEMNHVVGSMEDNSFIKYQKKELQSFIKEVAVLKKKLKLK